MLYRISWVLIMNLIIITKIQSYKNKINLFQNNLFGSTIAQCLLKRKEDICLIYDPTIKLSTLVKDKQIYFKYKKYIYEFLSKTKLFNNIIFDSQKYIAQKKIQKIIRKNPDVHFVFINHFVNNQVNQKILKQIISLKNIRLVFTSQYRYDLTNYKYKLLYFPINPNLKSLSKRKQNYLRIGFFSRISEVKNIIEFLKFANDYYSISQNIKLFITATKIIKLNYTPKIKLIKYVSYDNIEKLFANVDFLFFMGFKQKDAFGMLPIDALFCGVPPIVIGNNSPGKIFKKNKFPFVFPIYNFECIFNKINNNRDYKVTSELINNVKKSIFNTNKQLYKLIGFKV